jgi:hypothetical protein
MAAVAVLPRRSAVVSLRPFKLVQGRVQMFSAILAAVFLAQATPAAADDSAPAEAAATISPSTNVSGVKVPAAKPNKDGLVCHNQMVIGSRIPQKLCYTPAQEEARTREDQETMNLMQRPGGSNGNQNGMLPTPSSAKH